MRGSGKRSRLLNDQHPESDVQIEDCDYVNNGPAERNSGTDNCRGRNKEILETGLKWLKEGGPPRLWRSKTWRSPSSPQIHQKYIYMWTNSYRTPTKRWQKTSDCPKGKKTPRYLGRAKEKRKNKTKE